LEEIRFKDRKLRELCEKQAVARKKLGEACAHKLRKRLADLEAAETVTDLVAGNPHPLKHDRAGQFALDLTGGQRSDTTQTGRIDRLVAGDHHLH
jgi:toxin HigB-1